MSKLNLHAEFISKLEQAKAKNISMPEISRETGVSQNTIVRFKLNHGSMTVKTYETIVNFINSKL